MPAAHNADVLNGLSAARKKFLGGNEFTVGNSTAAPEQSTETNAEPKEAPAPAVKTSAAAPKAAKTDPKATSTKA